MNPFAPAAAQPHIGLVADQVVPGAVQVGDAALHIGIPDHLGRLVGQRLVACLLLRQLEGALGDARLETDVEVQHLLEQARIVERDRRQLR
jgi:hypothetical protein